MGELLSFKSEFEADLDIVELARPSGAMNCRESIFGTKKFFLEVQMLFKEASQQEIENVDKVKLSMTAEEAQDGF